MKSEAKIEQHIAICMGILDAYSDHKITNDKEAEATEQKAATLLWILEESRLSVNEMAIWLDRLKRKYFNAYNQSYKLQCDKFAKTTAERNE